MLPAIIGQVLRRYLTDQLAEMIVHAIEDAMGYGDAEEKPAATPGGVTVNCGPQPPRVLRWDEEPDPYLAECLYDRECSRRQRADDYW